MQSALLLLCSRPGWDPEGTRLGPGSTGSGNRCILFGTVPRTVLCPINAVQRPDELRERAGLTPAARRFPMGRRVTSVWHSCGPSSRPGPARVPPGSRPGPARVPTGSRPGPDRVPTRSLLGPPNSTTNARVSDTLEFLVSFGGACPLNTEGSRPARATKLHEKLKGI